MNKTLKIKIFASFMLLIALLAVAGIISIVEYRSLSKSFNMLIQDNYKSIEASKTMLEALEREDSGILLLMLGDWDAGMKIVNYADSVFLLSLKTAKNNLTETNEEIHIKNIENSYSTYKARWKRPIVDTDKQGNISWYKNDIHQLFLTAKISVNELMDLNQTSMYKEASILQEKSERAIMHGIVAIISALVFSILLNFFITKYFVYPISELANSVNNYRDGENKLRSNIKSNDEIKKLETAINDLLQRIVKNNK
ncbi:MAG: HAMP domain-containing protein [Bacteroidales bacterium]|nr:HAMP domain-containing protein [Bacteroidales bacterium]